MKKVLFKFIFVTAITIASLSAFNLVYAVENASTTPDNITEVIATSTPSTEEASTSTEENILSINLTIRYNDEIIFADSIDLTTTTYHDQINNLDYDLMTYTVFSSLVKADISSANFDITDDQYNSYYQSFYLRCITLNTSTSIEACDNWQYTINGQYPYHSMDGYELSGGENVYIYFGDRYKLNTSKVEYNTSETITSTLQEYSFLDNTWTNKPGQEILLTEPIAFDYSNWPPTIFASSTTNESGETYFNQSSTGTYYITLANDYWPGVNITVTSTVSTTQNNTTGSSGGGGSSSSANYSSTTSQVSDSVNKILNYFKTQQNEDGSILDGGTSDWVAISFGANGQYSKDIKKTSSSTSLYNFIYNYDFNGFTDLNLCASYPRHIMALLASGVDKNDSKILDLKNRMVSVECYTDNLYGFDGINDDIFAIISLLSLDYDINSNIITDIKNTILNDQTNEGAFTWTGYPGADVTGAVINALSYAKNKGINIETSVINNAKNYLKSTQLSDGGWGYGTSDILTTSWVLLGLNAESESMSNWNTASGYNPLNPLVDQLQVDGTYDTSWSPGTVDWFGLKHAVPSLLGKSWPIILTTVAQPVSSGSGNGSIEIIITPTTTPTSTQQVVTSTPEIIIEDTTTTEKIDIIPVTLELPLENIENNNSLEKKYKVKTTQAQNTVEEVQGEKITENSSTTIEAEKINTTIPETSNSSTEKESNPLSTSQKVAIGLGIITLLYGLFLLFKIFV